ncbi:hypothetical protein FQR65_LT00456 [Abscondita terminalis]|nr:hypothetical protein FQR65_LT00456 [Abscondita terminalis]
MATNITVHLVIDDKVVYIPVTPVTVAEDVCVILCKQLSIGPVARHLFALRITGNQIYIPSISTFNSNNDNQQSYDFRIRYKMADTAKLKEVDQNAYDYYFYQVRNDVLENKIPGLLYENCRRELVGLGVTDMYRVMKEKGLSRESVENEYRKYIPREALKRHSIFIKKPIHDSLRKIERAGYDSWYIKLEYLKQLEALAPEYLAEQYRAISDLDGTICNVCVKVSTLHETSPGIRISCDSKCEKWKYICNIEDLCHVSVRNDSTVEISRKNGVPFYLKFVSIAYMLSFVSVLDGYYRLTCKWIFNLCKDVPTPSLKKLYAMKCHGPVGGEFSYAKLEDKRNNCPGCFIIRESESKYNVYYIDVCMKDSNKPKTFKLERLVHDEFIFNDDLRKYKSVHQLIAAYSDPKEYIYLRECLPPSEYDKSPLLLCRNQDIVGDSLTDILKGYSLQTFTPICINSKHLQMFKGPKKEHPEDITIEHRGIWRLAKGEKIEVAIKSLKDDFHEKYLKEFIDLAGGWGFLQCGSIVRLYGITMNSPVAMVLEQLPLGPLDSYLRDNKFVVKVVDLIEASSNLASALWYLEENGLVHGNIRCRKLIVSYHQENSFAVKLSDPGVIRSYASTEVHWIPVECYSDLEYAKHCSAADVWAFGTTLWEIFMFGQPIKETNHIDCMKFYVTGNRLPQPSKCPDNIYHLLQECWDADPYRRKQPQALMRDISHILYQVYNSRRMHSYTKVSIKSDAEPKNNFFPTVGTGVGGDSDDLIPLCNPTPTEEDLYQKWPYYPDIKYKKDRLDCMQSILVLDACCTVILQPQSRIGQGFYGEVYKGTLEYDDGQSRQVAVKKLKTSTVSTCLQDFEREIAIMKTLKHPNIVEILGVLEEPEISLVMEFVHHGSLQSYLKIHRDYLTTKQLLKYACDIAQGMAYLVTKNIVHRDLATRNILVVDDNHVKISDFGLAQVMEANEYYVLKTIREMPIKWFAPESLQDGKFSPRSDAWSYGVTLCEMFAYGEEPTLQIEKSEGSFLGHEQQNLLKAIESGIRFPCPPMCPQSVYVHIIYPCWHLNPHERPTFKQLCVKIQELLTQH